MSYFVKNDVSIYYEDSGEDLPALLILARWNEILARFLAKYSLGSA